MDPQLLAFYDRQPEALRGCLLALRDLILRFDAGLSETRKYGMPCFTLGKKHFCYLWVDKDKALPYLLFVDGAQITHPALVQGKRARMKVLYVDPARDLPLTDIETVLGLARALRPG